MSRKKDSKKVDALNEKQFAKHMNELQAALLKQAKSSLSNYDWLDEVNNEDDRKRLLDESMKSVFGEDLTVTR